MDLNHFWHRAKNYAFKRGYKQDADDFAQYASHLFSTGRNATLNQLLVDYLRQTYQDARSKSFHIQTELDQNFFGISENYEQILTDTDLKSILKTMPPHDRMIVNLTIKWGFNQKEIADLLCVNESNVSQKMRDIHLKMRDIHIENRIEKRKRRDKDNSRN
jgi:RNA polymerase sigma factor (sigma-70 family)